MRVQLFTLRFSATLGGFDSTRIETFTRDKELLEFREHFFLVNEVPHLLCVLTWQEAIVSQRDLELAAETQAEVEAQRSHKSRSNPRGPKGERTDPTAGLDEAGRLLFNELREWRRAAARKEGVPPYIVFTNRHLLEMVARRPDSANGLMQLNGVGPGKVAKWGAAVLPLLAGQAPPPTPPEVESDAAPAVSPEAEAPCS